MGYDLDYRLSTGVVWSTFATGLVTNSATVTGLTNGSTYVFRVSAVNAIGGTTSNPVSAVPAGAPSVPLSLLANAGDGQAVLSWSIPATNGGSAITGYRVEKSVGGGAWTFVASMTTLSTTVTGLTNGVPVAFRVSAVNAMGIGNASSTVMALPLVVADAPTSLSVIALDSSVVLSWTAPVRTGGAPITGYEIERSANGGTTYTTVIADTGNPATSAVVTGLTNGSEYRFRVRTLTFAGVSATPSNVAIATPFGSSAAPTWSSAVASDSAITLAWVAPAVNGGTPITGYRVETSTNGTTWVDAFANTGSTAVTAQLIGLTNGTTVFVRVSAITAWGPGAPSAVATATPLAPANLPFPLTAVAGAGEATLNWVTPTIDGGSPITGYRIEKSTNSGVSWSIAFSDTASSATFAVVGNLAAGVLTQFRVSALTRAGVGAISQIASTTPNAAPVTTITAVAGDAQVSLTWGAVQMAGVTGYRIQRSIDSGASWVDAAPDVSDSTLTTAVVGLTNGTAYAFRVVVLTNAGAGDASGTAVAMPVGTPLAPTSVVATAGDASVALRWAIPASSAGRVLTGYRIETSTDGLSWTIAIADTGSVLPNAVVTGLTNGTTYQFRVTALAGSALGATSSATSTKPGRAPGVPSVLSATPGDASVSLAWTAPVDLGGGAIVGYRIDRSTDGGTTWTTVIADTATTSTSATVSSLTNGATYTYRVAAITEFGTGAATSPASTQPRGLAGPPTSLTLSPSDSQLTLNWSAPVSDGGSAVTGYRVEQTTDGGTTWTTLATINSPATATTLSGLTNGTAYAIRVVALSAAGAGTPSTQNIGTPAALAGRPGTPSATSSSGQVVLSWSAPASNGGATITQYVIEVSSDGGATWTSIATSATTSATLTGLTNGTAYAFRVRATNAAGTGLPSGLVATTPAGAPGAPTNLAVVP
jgi:titin